MKYYCLFILLPAFWLVPVFAAAQSDPLQSFTVIIQSNMFDPNRGLPQPIRPADGGAYAPVSVPTATLTLTGVAILREAITAVFTGSSAELTGIHRLGDRLADLSLAALDLQGATLMQGEEKLRLPVGSSLVKTADTAWQVSTAPPTATGTFTMATPSATSAAPVNEDSNEILRRMRERRQKELNP